MRRFIATVVLTGFLVGPAPLVRGGGDWDPIQIIRKVVQTILHRLAPSPTDTGDSLSPPKP